MEELCQDLCPVGNLFHYMIDEALFQFGITNGCKHILHTVSTFVQHGEGETFRAVNEVHVLFLHQVFKQKERAEDGITCNHNRFEGPILLKEHVTEVLDHLEEEVAFDITLGSQKVPQTLDLVIEVLLTAEDRELLFLIAYRGGTQEISICVTG
ncbi:hypothetical protein SDC9_129399 [bioreactor metagenome]|uniref:Uncharacterized protein n=1 Tax=bioreactor metagenome TaxID=1076179 RepID=A0A645CZR0_9ZZZZ